MESVESAQLRQEIIKAFSNSIYPGDDTLVADNEYHLEQQQVKNFFKGKRWQDLSLQSLHDEYVGDESACLFFMEGEAVRYYLPAFMLISLSEYDDADLIVDSVVDVLTPKKKSGKEYDQFAIWAESFSAEQRNVISRFLLHLKEYHADDFIEDEPGIALNRLWLKFLN